MNNCHCNGCGSADSTGDCAANSEKVRELNDAFRRTFTGGMVVITAGIEALRTEKRPKVIVKVRAFEAFTSDNDPWQEHDMGAFDIEVEGPGFSTSQVHIFWQIAYYDLARAYLSPDPADPAVTERVLTIMLGREY